MPASTSPGESVFFLLLVAAAVVGAVVWTGAALAALTVGAGPPGGLVAAVQAIPRLARNPGQPSAAWTPIAGDAAALPGPVVYWAMTVLAGLLAVGLVVAGRVLWVSMRPNRRRLGVDAQARFASRRELRPLLVRRPVPGRLVLGSWGRKLVATESQRWDPVPDKGWAGVWAWVTGRRRPGRSGDVTSVAIVGPTRSGKTAECAIPAVLEWVGPAILLSVKRDLMDTTIARRRILGEVRVFDPGGLSGRNVNPSVTIEEGELARWSPLRTAHTAAGAKKAGDALASWTPQAGVDGGMSFWTDQGKVLFTGLLGAAALSEQRSMRDVAEWVFNMSMPGSEAGCPPAEILDKALAEAATHDAADAAVLHLAAIWNRHDPKLQSSVYSTATTVVTPWLDPNVLAATDLDPKKPGEWVDLDWLMNTGPDGKNANTLYLLVSHDDYQRLSPVLAGLLSDIKAQAYEWESVGRKFPAPLLMLIDEAGNMPLDWLPEVSSTCAGLGIQLVTVWQSLAQMTESYGRRADVLLTNHATKLFFPAASDDSTLSYQSKIVGEEDVERQSWSTDLTGGGRRSISGQENHESLVPYFLARLPGFGQALMIHSNTPPAQIVGRRWWKDRRLAAMVPGAVAARHRPSNDGPGPWHPTVPAANPAADAPPEGPTESPPVPPPGVDPVTGEITTTSTKEMSDAR